MKVITSVDFSEIVVTLFKPEEITEQEFVERVKEDEVYLDNMKKIIEQIQMIKTFR